MKNLISPKVLWLQLFKWWFKTWNFFMPTTFWVNDGVHYYSANLTSSLYYFQCNHTQMNKNVDESQYKCIHTTIQQLIESSPHSFSCPYDTTFSFSSNPCASTFASLLIPCPFPPTLIVISTSKCIKDQMSEFRCPLRVSWKTKWKENPDQHGCCRYG